MYFVAAALLAQFPPPSPTPPLIIANTDGTATFTIISGFEHCHLENRTVAGQTMECVTDGSGAYESDENCEIRANGDLFVYAIQYAVESGYDFLTINGAAYTQSSSPPRNLFVDEDKRIFWSSDGSANGDGFTLCPSATVFSFDPPSPMPPPPPSASPFPPGMAPPPYYRQFAPAEAATCSNYSLVTSIDECLAAAVFVGAVPPNYNVTLITQPSAQLPAGCYAAVSTVCEEDCWFAGDGDCDDGGPGAEWASCPSGSECSDCGPRPDPMATTQVFYNPDWDSQGTCGDDYTCLCRHALSPSAPPTIPPPASPVPADQLWQVTDGGEFCHLITPPVQGHSEIASSFDGQSCITDGIGDHESNERCTIKAYKNLVVTAAYFETEAGYDGMIIGGRSFSGTFPAGQGIHDTFVPAFGTIEWSSDSSLNSGGFVICAIEGLVLPSPPEPPTNPPPPPPPPLAPPPPGRPYSDVMICEDNCNFASDGDCDDGGPGAEYAGCSRCQDCTDCGPTNEHLCPLPSPRPPSPPPRPPHGPALCGQLFCVIEGQEFCRPTNHTNFPDMGECVWDGPGDHGSGEECTIELTAPANITAVFYDIESDYDYITFRPSDGNGGFYSAIPLKDTGIGGFNDAADFGNAPAGSQLVWSSDIAVNSGGFTVCFAAKPPPPSSPPPPPGTLGGSVLAQSANSETKLETGSLIAIICAALAVVAAVGVGAYLLHKRKKGRSSTTVVRAIPTTTIANPVTAASTSSTTSTNTGVELDAKDSDHV